MATKSQNSSLRWIIIIGVLVVFVVGALFFRAPKPHIQLAAEHIFTVGTIPGLGDFVITNTMIATWASMIVLIALSYFATRKMTAVPSGVQNLMEAIIEAIAGFVESVAGKKHGPRIFNLVATIFLFLLISNWMGLLPGYETIGLVENGEHGETIILPFLRPAATDLNTTLGLALISVAFTQIFGVKTIGAGNYIQRFFNFKAGPIGIFVGLLELVSEFAKIVSFSFRLFGNIFAGAVLLAVITFLVPWLASLPFMALELFVGFMQALVFGFLTLVFCVIAVSEHEEHHHEEHEERVALGT